MASHASTSSASLVPPGVSGVVRRQLKRTNSTADFEAIDELNLPPNLQGKTRAGVDADSDDEDVDMGTREDWTSDEDDKPSARVTLTPPRRKLAGPDRAVTPPARMPVDGLDSSPVSSPTLARRGNTYKLSKVDLPASSDEEDADDNPFLAKPNEGYKSKKESNERQKVSYVFRGKKVTYDVPLSTLYPEHNDVFGNCLPTARVLFPKPASPVIEASTSSPPLQSSAEHNIRNVELMQTPRRPRTITAAPVEATPPLVFERAAFAAQTPASKKGPSAPYIPPTPASLPQKTKEERQLERERFNASSRGYHARNSSITVNGGFSNDKRYAPYPLR